MDKVSSSGIRGQKKSYQPVLPQFETSSKSVSRQTLYLKPIQSELQIKSAPVSPVLSASQRSFLDIVLHPQPKSAPVSPSSLIPNRFETGFQSNPKRPRSPSMELEHNLLRNRRDDKINNKIINKN